MSTIAALGSAAPSLQEVAQLAQNLARNCRYAVFPCRADKRPACPHGFKDATHDPDEVPALWRRFPGPLIGVATGEKSGFDVLDIDVKHDAARAWLLTAEAQIPPTRTYQTRSGGFHLLFRHAPGVHNTESHIARGIDTRGEGGYIVFWFGAGFPCIDHSPVAEWPEWLLEALFYVPEPDPAPLPRVARYTSTGTSAQNMVDASLRKLREAAEGSRHHTLRAASCTLGGLLEAAGMSRADAADQLLHAILEAGGARVDQQNARATIEWGLTKGAQSPLTAGRR